MPDSRRESNVPAVTAAAANSDRAAPLPPPPGRAIRTSPANPTTRAVAVRADTASPYSHQAGSRINNGWAFANTAAVPVAKPATPANMAANARLTLTNPVSVIQPQARAPRG